MEMVRLCGLCKKRKGGNAGCSERGIWFTHMTLAQLSYHLSSYTNSHAHAAKHDYNYDRAVWMTPPPALRCQPRLHRPLQCLYL